MKGYSDVFFVLKNIQFVSENSYYAYFLKLFFSHPVVNKVVLFSYIKTKTRLICKINGEAPTADCSFHLSFKYTNNVFVEKDDPAFYGIFFYFNILLSIVTVILHVYSTNRKLFCASLERCYNRFIGTCFTPLLP